MVLADELELWPLSMRVFPLRNIRAPTWRGWPAMLEVRLLTDVSPEETEQLVERGWRRFGPGVFPADMPAVRGVCIAAGAGEGVPVKQEPAAGGAEVQRGEGGMGTPRADAERVELYRKWHEAREAACGWQENPLDEEGYRRQFCFPHACGREMTYWVEGRLAGVGLVDEMPRSVSSTYFFFDPDFGRLSLGVYSALCEISLALQLGKSYVYFGYRVNGCKSLMYKSQFRPNELLLERPEEGDEAEWRQG